MGIILSFPCRCKVCRDEKRIRSISANFNPVPRRQGNCVILLYSHGVCLDVNRGRRGNFVLKNVKYHENRFCPRLWSCCLSRMTWQVQGQSSSARFLRSALWEKPVLNKLFLFLIFSFFIIVAHRKNLSPVILKLVDFLKKLLGKKTA